MELLILTGTCGVGKSTLARAWAKSNQGAAVDCDLFTSWIFKDDFPRLEKKGAQLVGRLAYATALAYVKEQMPVAIEYVWYPWMLNTLMDDFRNEGTVKEVKVVWLYCDLKENRKRDLERIPENQMKDRVDELQKDLENQIWPDYVHHLDTTGLSILETLSQLEKLVPTFL